jgi:hypothetical protein
VAEYSCGMTQTTSIAATAHRIADAIDASNLDGIAWHIHYTGPGAPSADEVKTRRPIASAEIRAALAPVTAELRSITDNVTGDELSARTRRFLHADDLEIRPNWVLPITTLDGPLRAAAGHWNEAYRMLADGAATGAAASLALVEAELERV